MSSRKKKEYTPEEKAEIVKRLKEGRQRARELREAKKRGETLTPEKIEKVKLPDPPLDVKVPDLTVESKTEKAKPKRTPKTAKLPTEEEQKVEIINQPPPSPPPPPPPPPIPEVNTDDEDEGEYEPLSLPDPPPPPPVLKRELEGRVIKQPSVEEMEPQFRPPPPRRRPQLPPEVLQAKQRQIQIQERKNTSLDIAYSSLF